MKYKTVRKILSSGIHLAMTLNPRCNYNPPCYALSASHLQNKNCQIWSQKVFLSFA